MTTVKLQAVNATTKVTTVKLQAVNATTKVTTVKLQAVNVTIRDYSVKTYKSNRIHKVRIYSTAINNTTASEFSLVIGEIGVRGVQCTQVCT